MRQRARGLFGKGLALVAVSLASVQCSPIRNPTFPAASPGIVGRKLSRADAVSDVDTLVYTLERVHPDLYGSHSRESFLAAKQQLIARLPDSISRGDLWIRLSPLIATLGDGHTNISYPGEEVLRLVQAGTLVFPPQLATDDDGKLVVSLPFGTRGVRTGDRLVALNGRNADSLFAEFVAAFSGESSRFRSATAMNSFRDLLVLHGINAPYTLDIVGVDGLTRVESFDGITRDSLSSIARRGRAAAANASPNISYRALGSRIGYLNFRSMGGDLGAFRGVVADMFSRIAADSDTTVIIDLRSNGGGDTRLGDELLGHFTTTPYRSSSRKDWKMSAEYRNYLKSLVKPPLNHLPIWWFHPIGRRLFQGPDGSIVTFDFPADSQPRAEPFFTGRTCVLIGEGTFSSASDLADAIKTYHLATLIGEETGGRPNSFGEVYFFRLPRSELSVAVSSARFVAASGDTTDHRGVVPDIAVRTTPADRSALRDPVLERAKRCPRL